MDYLAQFTLGSVTEYQRELGSKRAYHAMRLYSDIRVDKRCHDDKIRQSDAVSADGKKLNLIIVSLIQH